MLKHLLVENYALIEKLNISFNEGLTVITGETGAGKSILLGALSLILGQRADTQTLLDKERKCIVEGTFYLGNILIKDLFDLHQLDYDETSTFRREITPQGKSRAFVNDTPVNLNVLKDLSERLIDIHSQHQNLIIGESSFQFDVVDSFSSGLQQVAEYRPIFRQWQRLLSELAELQASEKRSKSDFDYFSFQFEELDKARLNPHEFRQIEEELEVLLNAELIKNNFQKASFLLTGADVNSIVVYGEIIQLLKPLARFNEKYTELLKRVESLIIETKDLNGEMVRESENLAFDPEKASLLQQRFDYLNRLLQKHHASGIEELEKIRDDYQEKLRQVESLEEKIIQCQNEIKLVEGQLKEKASEISNRRKKAIPSIEKEVTTLLKQLGMPGGSFVISCNHVSDLTINGADRISFLFNANLGGEPREIAKVASGGELSRLMLTIKSMISQRTLLPTIIFDEIDAGISGETASRVANILNTISKNMQVIAITHLPQIASRGRDHLVVHKVVEKGKTRTEIKKIENHERILEVAQMLGGLKPTEAMMATARELISNTGTH
ncbi:MAG TPA: DNA repair protein RecN [Bacteroidales bacterium]|nr:DNA repair protein RecN [Bacteroidales bacterium]